MSGRSADHGSCCSDFPQIELDGHVIQAPKRQRDLTDIRVAGALAHSIDRALNPRCSAANSSNGASRSHSKIIMAVPVYRRLRSYPIANVTNEEFGRLGATSAHGVDNYDLGRTSVERGPIGYLEKLA